MNARPYTEEELTNIVADFDNHVDLSHMSQAYDRTKITLTVMKSLWQRIRDGRLSEDHYDSKSRLVIMLKNILAKRNPAQTVKATISPLERIEKAFEVFQTELVIAVNDEAERRAEERTQEIEKEYEQRLEKMQKLLDTAKESNLAGFLRKAWGKSEVNQ